MHLLDVLFFQHAKWTAKRVRRGLFGQSIVGFTITSWSGIQLKESTNDTASQQQIVQPKKTPRLLRSFATAWVVARGKSSLVPGVSLYDDVDMDARNAECQRFFAGRSFEGKCSGNRIFRTLPIGENFRCTCFFIFL